MSLLCQKGDTLARSLTTIADFHIKFDGMFNLETLEDSRLNWVQTELERHPKIVEGWMSFYINLVNKKDEAKGENLCSEKKISIKRIMRIP